MKLLFDHVEPQPLLLSDDWSRGVTPTEGETYQQWDGRWLRFTAAAGWRLLEEDTELWV